MNERNKITELEDKFGRDGHSFAELHARRTAHRRELSLNQRVAGFAALVTITGLGIVAGKAAFHREVNHEHQQSAADAAALQANFVAPTEAQLRADGIVLPPHDSENSH